MEAVKKALLAAEGETLLDGAHGLLLLYPAHRRKSFLAWAVTVAIVGALFAPWFLFVVGLQVRHRLEIAIYSLP